MDASDLTILGSGAHRPGRRAQVLRRSTAVLAGLVTAILGLPAAAAAQPAAPAQLGAADLALLNGVRLAGLWEMPAGQMAAERGGQERVRQVGAQLAADHAELDQLVVDAANKLGVQLPTEPNADQKKWLDEMTSASSDREFDQIFVDRLRAAHGKIFPVIGTVRSGTRNDTVRTLAQDSNRFVLSHLTLLESTGLVRYAELPPAGLPADQAPIDSLQEAATARGAAGSGFNPTAIWILVLAALVLGAVATVRVFRPR